MSSEIELTASTACLWPVSAYMPTEQIYEGMQKLTQNAITGLELLPSRAVVFENNGIGLTVPRKAIGSLHDTWKPDRDRNSKLGYPNTPLDRFLSSSLFFPPTPAARSTLGKLNNIDNPIPTVFHWAEEADVFTAPTLEVHSLIGQETPLDNTWPPRRIVEWAEQTPNGGIVIDLSQRKFGDYCKAVGINSRDQIQAIQDLIPVTREVHFQVGDRSELNAVLQGDTDHFIGMATRMAKRNNLPIVLEINALQMMTHKVNPARVYRKTIEFIENA